MRRLIMTLSVMAIALSGGVALAGEWHANNTNLCTDCHTMHFSMQHNWDGTTPVPTAGQDGNWLSASGPNTFLLKAPVNQLCLACHDGQTFAPDVLMTNANTGYRQAGALNEETGADGYEAWMGHTLDSTLRPPGYDAALSPAGDAYPTGSVLECTSCHTQHGSATVYRNLGPRNSANQPSYIISTTNDNTKDVWVNIAAGYAANSGDAATFAPYYDQSKVFFNRNDVVVGGRNTSNKIDVQCSVCHGQFHGGGGDAGMGGVPADVPGNEQFLRHPTSSEFIKDGQHGRSNLARFQAANIKVKVYADDHATYTDPTPGCVSCHKAHGNKNPFGLIFISRTATAGTATEEGANGTEVAPPAGAPTYMRGYRNLCGQCHGQGN